MKIKVKCEKCRPIPIWTPGSTILFFIYVISLGNVIDRLAIYAIAA